MFEFFIYNDLIKIHILLMTCLLYVCVLWVKSFYLQFLLLVVLLCGLLLVSDRSSRVFLYQVTIVLDSLLNDLLLTNTACQSIILSQIISNLNMKLALKYWSIFICCIYLFALFNFLFNRLPFTIFKVF